MLIIAQSNSPHVIEPRFHYHVHRSPPPVHILSQMKPVHALTLISFQIHFSIILKFTRSLPIVFTSKMLVAFTDCVFVVGLNGKISISASFFRIVCCTYLPLRVSDS
jgi:hypothetical protein